jgi:hypothetical protein
VRFAGSGEAKSHGGKASGGPVRQP